MIIENVSRPYLDFSACCSGSGGWSETTSPQQTWTAGMTKGLAPKELIEQLKRNRSAPSLEEGVETESPPAHPLDVLRAGRKVSDSLAQSSDSLEKSSTGLPGKDPAALTSKGSGADFDTLSSFQVWSV